MKPTVRTLSGALVALLVAAFVVGLGSSRVGAASPPSQMNCQGSGSVNLTNGVGTAINWSVSLSGVSCSSSAESLGGTAAGSGTSDDLGVCPTPPSSPNSSLTVDNLAVNMTESLLGSVDNVTYQINESWSSPKTSFPESTPFSIVRGGQIVGGGTIYTHIFAHCPPSGTPSAFVTWSEQTPF